ncbi:MAG: hypothetical protein RIR63_811, partial [Actinomycetota bacterium]
TRSSWLPRPASPIPTSKVETVHPHGCGSNIASLFSCHIRGRVIRGKISANKPTLDALSVRQRWDRNLIRVFYAYLPEKPARKLSASRRICWSARSCRYCDAIFRVQFHDLLASPSEHRVCRVLSFRAQRLTQSWLCHL